MNRRSTSEGQKHTAKATMTSATLLEVKRFATHDGPGIRTSFFLKGCPLRCRWCHNPESISPKPQLGYYSHKCLNCGECVEVCPTQAHSIQDGKHCFDRSKCNACGRCVEVCLGDALRLYGKSITVDEAAVIAMEDRDFYQADGGVTLSGGEPLLQPEFCYDLLKGLKQDGINTAVDTCGCIGWDLIERMLPLTDMFLFDFKHADSKQHHKLTGQGNERIIGNLKRLSDSGAKIEIRIPLIPGCNDSKSNLEATGKILAKLQIERVKVLPYHNMAKSKYFALELPDTMPKVENLDNDAGLQNAVAILQSFGITVC